MGLLYWKVAGALASSCLIIMGLRNLFAHLGALQLLQSVIDAYIIMAGCTAGVLEFKEYILPQRYVTIIQREAMLFSRPYGRAIAYIFLGALMMFDKDVWSFFLGLLAVVIGCFVFFKSKSAHSRLVQKMSEQYDPERVEKVIIYQV